MSVSVKEKPAYNAKTYLCFALDQDELNIDTISLLIDQYAIALWIPNKYEKLPFTEVIVA